MSVLDFFGIGHDYSFQRLRASTWRRVMLVALLVAIGLLLGTGGQWTS